jgi:hypothetical protein
MERMGKKTINYTVESVAEVAQSADDHIWSALRYKYVQTLDKLEDESRCRFHVPDRARSGSIVFVFHLFVLSNRVSLCP